MLSEWADLCRKSLEPELCPTWQMETLVALRLSSVNMILNDTEMRQGSANFKFSSALYGHLSRRVDGPTKNNNFREMWQKEWPWCGINPPSIMGARKFCILHGFYITWRFYITRRLHGINRLLNGINQLIHGVTRLINCITRLINGLTRRINGQSPPPASHELAE